MILYRRTKIAMLCRYTSMLIVLVVAGCRSTESLYRINGGVVLQKGDLLFQDLDCGELCDAIERVTYGFEGYNFSHVGIVADVKREKITVLEATSDGVTVTNLDTFLDRSYDEKGHPKVAVGRVKEPYRGLIQAALEEGMALVGKSYDRSFDISNDAYYCSELIYEIFRRANGGKPVFKLKPMTFKKSPTGRILDTWQKYFEKQNMKVPEGQSGINPADISRSRVVDIVYFYGKPSRKS